MNLTVNAPSHVERKQYLTLTMPLGLGQYDEEATHCVIWFIYC